MFGLCLDTCRVFNLRCRRLHDTYRLCLDTCHLCLPQVQMLTHILHPNVVGLIGAYAALFQSETSTSMIQTERFSPKVLHSIHRSDDGPHLCLVYPLLSGGSLQDRLFRFSAHEHLPLTPTQRLLALSDVVLVHRLKKWHTWFDGVSE